MLRLRIHDAKRGNIAVTDDLTDDSIPAAAMRAAERFGSKRAFVDGAVVESFEDIRDGMLDVAASLIVQGVEPGDRVALWAPNSVSWVWSALGILAAGAWLVPINTRFKPAEVVHILDNVDASRLFVADGFLGGHQVEGVRQAAPGLRSLAEPIFMPGPGERSRPEWDEFVGLGDDRAKTVALARIQSLGPDDVSDVIFTSGTTGLPKGVMLRHGASLRAYRAFNEGFAVEEDDRVLIALPFFHCFGYKAGWMNDLIVGATTFPVAVFDGLKVMEMIDHHRITHMPGSPTMFWPLLDDPRRSEYDLSSLRSVVVGAASVPLELVRRLKDEIGVEQALNGYGLTENHAIIATSRRGDSPERVTSRVGRVIEGIEVKVVDTDGNDLGRNVEGELWVRGYTTMTGYYGDPEATASVFTDEWLHTGDVGVLFDDDYISVTDRKKDIYITGGFNVAPAEVEASLLEFGPIGQVAVVGIPHPTFGEVGAAFVVPIPGQSVTPEAVIGYAKEHLANYKVPRLVEIVDSLPLNATGKVLKGDLRDRLAGR
jgi:acyl-CoA synthetase (AMP-forming)/AMP-acid ligase II